MILGRESISKMASDALVWLCVKDNNSFMRKNKCAQTKRNGQITLSAEPGNLTSLSSFKYSGIANSKVIKFDVEDTATAGKTDVKITLGCKVLPARRLFLKFNPQGRRRRVLEGRETRRTDGTSLQGGGWGLSVVDWICGSAGSVALPGRGGCGHRSLFWRFVRFESAADISASDAAAAMQQQ